MPIPPRSRPRGGQFPKFLQSTQAQHSAVVLEAIRKNIVFYANGCVAIVEAVAQRKVDAAFGWSAFQHLAPNRIEIVELPPEQQVLRGTGVGLLNFARHRQAAVMLMDFLATPEARSCYERYGWVVP